MLFNRLALLLPFVLVLQACKDDGVAKNNPDQQPKSEASLKKDKSEAAVFDFVVPTPNLTSPDNAVKSWWALNDAVVLAVHEDCKRGDPAQAAYRAARVNLAAGNTKDFYQESPRCLLETFDRTIERASVETDTRAVVMANIKNNTKLPEGISLSKYSKDEVEKGISYKYVLTRESDKWYVDEVYFHSSTNVVLKRDPWQQEYKVDKNKDEYLGVSGQ